MGAPGGYTRWVHQVGAPGVCIGRSPLAVLPGVSWCAGGAAVPATSQALTGPREPAGTTGSTGPSPPFPSPCPQPPALTGSLGAAAGRRRAGSPQVCQQWHPHRSQVHTGRRNPPPCCAGSPVGHTAAGGWCWEAPPEPRSTVCRQQPSQLTEQRPLSGWQLSEWPLHSHSSQCPKYRPPPVRV